MDIKNIFLCIHAIVFFSSCISGTDSAPEPAGHVTLIFSGAPDQMKTDKAGSRSVTVPDAATVRYIDRDCHEIRYCPRTIGNDTLTIPTYRGYAEILHLYQLHEEIPYLLADGDTVLVRYDRNLRPVLESKVSEENTMLYNMPWLIPGAIHDNGYFIGAIIENRRFLAAEKYLGDPEARKEYPGLETFFRSYHVDMDSVREAYETYRHRLSDSLDVLENGGEECRRFALWYRREILDGGYSMDRISRSDSLLHYITHRNRLMEYSAGYTDPLDYTGRFDIAAADTSLCSLARCSLLEYLIGKINDTGWTPYPDRTVRQYNSRYLSLTGDSTFVRPVVDKPNVSSTDGYTYDLVLHSIDGQRYTLAEVVARHRGKVLYADLWASWCAPCRSEMPSAKQLRDTYSREDIVFLYLSTDSSTDGWKRAVKDCGTDYLGKNYIILNQDDSAFAEEIKFRMIPRYLIFDRAGRLVNVDAPRPSSSGIGPELEKYLDD